MDSIQEVQEEYSLSGISFPSLNNIYSQEEEDIMDGDDATASANDVDGGRSNAVQNPVNGHDDEYDGYPTDEHTIRSFTQPKEKELKRLSILQLARNRLAKKNKPDDDKHKDFDENSSDDDDSTFLGNVDVADAENQVENSPDDSTFLVNADVDDVIIEDVQSPHSNFDHADGCTDTDADSNYDVHASTLSRASASTKASTIGDQILKESNMAAAQMAMDGNDNQSASTYSYRRAYVDNVTLGSTYTSTCSALTDDYSYNARRTGMSEAVVGNEVQEDQPYHDDDIYIAKRLFSGPVDVDTGAMMVQRSDNSHEESLARPPAPLPYLSNHPTYENSDHLARVVSFGEGHGYVDEEAARKFVTTGGSNTSSWCCGWFTSSSRMIKLVVLCSLLLMLISVASVALAIFLPNEEENGRIIESSAKSSEVRTETDEKTHGGSGIVTIEGVPKQNDVESLVPTGLPTPSPFSDYSTLAPSALAGNTKCEVGAQCFEEGSRCTDGTTETCCGETFDSFECECTNKGDNLEYMCFFTDACMAPSCETFEPTLPTSSPTVALGSKTATLTPSTQESDTYTTSAITDTPSVVPTFEPSTKPSTHRPSSQPTRQPTQQPTTNIPTRQPSKQPTFKPVTELPTKKPSNLPTTHPSKAPTDKPTPIPTEFPTIPPSYSAPMPTPVITQTATLRATQDTYVNAAYPQENYGKSRRFRIDGSPSRVWSFISFDTTSITKRQGQPTSNGEPRKIQPINVLQAKLRLYTLNEGGGGLFFALPYAQWAETSLTWIQMGEVDRTGQTKVGSASWFDAFRWYEIDVTDAFQGSVESSIVQTFLIKSVSYNGVEFASRERDSGLFGPELVMTYSADPGISTTAPVSAPPTHGPETVWPTYFPSASAQPPSKTPTKIPTSNPTKRPSVALTFAPSKRPSQQPLKQPTVMPTQFPTQKPSNHPSKLPTTRPPQTRAPHKRPKRPTRSPTTSPSPTDAPTETVLEKKSVARPSVAPSKSAAKFVPPGCSTASDISFPFKEALMPGQSTPNIHIIFPIQDTYVSGGIDSDKNYGSSGVLTVDSSSRALIEFDLGQLALTTIAYTVVSVSLRIFVDSVDGTRSLSIDRMLHSVEFEELGATWDSFGAPPLAKAGPTLKVTSFDEGKWLDVDISDIVDGSQFNKIALVVNDTLADGDAEKCVFASRETCHSPKLVVVTESI